MRRDPGTVLVTGAGSGIGRATAVLYAGRGAALALAGRDAAALEEVAGACRDAGSPAVVVVPTDVSDADACAALVEQTVARLGRIDVCVHSAGVAAYGRVEELPPEAFDRVVETNLLGTARLARALLPQLRRQGSGTFVIVGSVLGRIAVPMMGAYVTSKWGVRGLARVLSLEVRDAPGVRVTLVAPGSVDTAIYDLAGNWSGRRPRPPWPVATPESVARAVARTVARPRPERLTGWATPLMVAGWTLAPRLYNALVGPLMSAAGFRSGATARTGGNLWRPSREVAGAEESPAAHRGHWTA